MRSGLSCGVALTGSLLPSAAPPDGGEVLLRDAEVDEHRADLIDHDQRHVVSLHEIAGMHEQIARAAGDRRVNLA